MLLCFAAKNSLFGQRGDRRRWEGRPPHPPSGVVSPLGVTKTIRGVLVPAPPAAYGSVRFWGGLGGDRWPRLHCRRSGPLGWRRGSRRSRHGWGGPWGWGPPGGASGWVQLLWCRLGEAAWQGRREKKKGEKGEIGQKERNRPVLPWGVGCVCPRPGAPPGTGGGGGAGTHPAPGPFTQDGGPPTPTNGTKTPPLPHLVPRLPSTGSTPLPPEHPYPRWGPAQHWDP